MDLSGQIHNSLNGLHKFKGRPVDTNTFLKILNIISDTNQYMPDVQDISQALRQIDITFEPSQRIQRYLPDTYPVAFVSVTKSKPNVTLTIPDINFPIRAKRHVASILAESTGTLGGGKQKTAVLSRLSQITAKKRRQYDIRAEDDVKDCCITAVVATKDGRRLLAELQS